MAEDWQAVAAEIADAFREVGHGAWLLRPTFTGPEYDREPGPDLEIPVTLLGDTIALGLLDGTVIQASDRREAMAAEGTLPTPADRLRIGSTTYAIARAAPYAPGGVPLFFDLILRA